MAKKQGFRRGIEIGKKALEDSWPDVHTRGIRISSRVFIAYAAMAVVGFFLAVTWDLLGEGFLSENLLLAVLLATGIVITAFIGYTLVISAILGTIQNIYHKKDLPFFSMENLKSSVTILLAIVFFGFFALIAALVLSFSIEILIVVTLTASVVLAVRLFYFFPEIAIKKKGLFSALKSSISLTGGKFWETFSMGAIIALVAGLMGTFLNVAYSLVSTVAFTIIGDIGQLFGTIGVLILIPFTIAIVIIGAYVSAAILAIYFIFHTHVYMKAVKR